MLSTILELDEKNSLTFVSIKNECLKILPNKERLQNKFAYFEFKSNDTKDNDVLTLISNFLNQIGKSEIKLLSYIDLQIKYISGIISFNSIDKKIVIDNLTFQDTPVVFYTFTSRDLFNRRIKACCQDFVSKNSNKYNSKNLANSTNSYKNLSKNTSNIINLIDVSTTEPTLQNDESIVFESFELFESDNINNKYESNSLNILGKNNETTNVESFKNNNSCSNSLNFYLNNNESKINKDSFNILKDINAKLSLTLNEIDFEFNLIFRELYNDKNNDLDDNRNNTKNATNNSKDSLNDKIKKLVDNNESKVCNILVNIIKYIKENKDSVFFEYFKNIFNIDKSQNNKNENIQIEKIFSKEKLCIGNKEDMIYNTIQINKSNIINDSYISILNCSNSNVNNNEQLNSKVITDDNVNNKENSMHENNKNSNDLDCKERKSSEKIIYNLDNDQNARNVAETQNKNSDIINLCSKIGNITNNTNLSSDFDINDQFNNNLSELNKKNNIVNSEESTKNNNIINLTDNNSQLNDVYINNNISTTLNMNFNLENFNNNNKAVEKENDKNSKQSSPLNSCNIKKSRENSKSPKINELCGLKRNKSRSNSSISKTNSKKSNVNINIQFSNFQDGKISFIVNSLENDNNKNLDSFEDNALNFDNKRELKTKYKCKDENENNTLDLKEENTTKKEKEIIPFDVNTNPITKRRKKQRKGI